MGMPDRYTGKKKGGWFLNRIKPSYFFIFLNTVRLNPANSPYGVSGRVFDRSLITFNLSSF